VAVAGLDIDRRDDAVASHFLRDAEDPVVALLGVLATDEGEQLGGVGGQDTEQGDDGVFRIAKKVARDRVISTVDVEARHGHKSKARKFDGYKAHFSVDPDSELIDEVVVTPANTPDREAVGELVDSFPEEDPPEIVGDAAYGDGTTRAELRDAGVRLVAKLPPLRNTTGGFTKERFAIDLEHQGVTCPAGHTVAIRLSRRGGGVANFAPHCGSCPLASDCTKARTGRTITVHPHEDLLQLARAEQTGPEWQQRYRADRPMVERKIAHFVFRSWGGRRARTRGWRRVSTDVDTRAGALNLARLAVLGLRSIPSGWAITTT
jgi:IS5 family transposase